MFNVSFILFSFIYTKVLKIVSTYDHRESKSFLELKIKQHRIVLDF